MDHTFLNDGAFMAYYVMNYDVIVIVMYYNIFYLKMKCYLPN